MTKAGETRVGVKGEEMRGEEKKGNESKEKRENENTKRGEKWEKGKVKGDTTRRKRHKTGWDTRKSSDKRGQRRRTTLW